MPFLADFFQVLILLACIGCLALLSRRMLPEVAFPLHLCLAPVAFAAILFFLEHFLPLGQWPWLWLPGAGLFVYLAYQTRGDIFRQTATWYFLWGFAVCFFWCYSFPDIFPFSDRLNDHAQLTSYSAGGLLPAEDIWMKGEKSDTYYIFQYYAGGLIHRFLGTGPGMTFHLAYCVMAGLTVAAAASGVAAATRSRGGGILTALFMTLGGNGATLFTPFMNKDGMPTPLAAERFIGSYALPGTPEAQSAFGHALIQFMGPSKVDAPMEYYSYALYIGDYHPSLSCFLFLCLGLLAIGLAERAEWRSPTDRVCVAAAIASVFYSAISCTWDAPLQAVLVIGWLLYRQGTGRKDHGRFLALCAFVSFAAILPYFAAFAHETRGYSVHFQLVPERPPLLDWLVVMFPAVLPWLMAVFAARSRPLARLAAIVGLIVMSGTYIFEMHSIYGGYAEIYDSAMKWWGWVFTATLLLSLMAIWPYRVPRRLAIFLIGATIIANTSILAACWQTTAKGHMGRLDGYAWFTDDAHQNSIYHQLKARPKGVVLESAPDSDAAAITLAQFTGHYSLGGWTWFELFWRGNRRDISLLEQDRNKFYAGTLKDPLTWLNGSVPGGVNYIVWLQRDNAKGNGIWAGINDQIKTQYDWIETYRYGNDHWGLWIRRPSTPAIP